MERDRRLGGCRPHPMDVVARWDQDVEVPRHERAPLDPFESVVPKREDLLVLRASIEADETPGQVVVDRGLRARRNDEREERERAVASAEEERLADAAAHPALRRGRLELVREPPRSGEQLRKAGPDRLARLRDRKSV